jgi:hypothetical protein
MRSFDDRHLDDRMNTFQQYLNRLLNIPEICSERILEEFLSLANPLEFVAYKENVDSMLSHRGNSIVTLKGEEILDKSTFRVNS